jgi:hypothetical protein
MSNNLTPTFLETDYNTLKAKLTQLMKKSDTFKDYNYEGSNISMLIELVSYLGDLNTFFTNLLAKNMYEDTADVYETVHRLVRQKGYNPLGYKSSQVTITAALSGVQVGDVLQVPAWTSIDTGLTTDNGDSIYYTITQDHDFTADTAPLYEFDLIAREGEVSELEYKGSDLVDNIIILPFSTFDHGSYPFDIRAIQLTVNGTAWTRISDFYEDVTGLIDQDNVFIFNYDKYERYVIEFSSSRNVPETTDDINITMLKSNGVDGSIGAGTITEADDNFVVNVTRGVILSTMGKDDLDSFTNTEASFGAVNPETVEQMKSNSKAVVHSQLRNVTTKDYISHLNGRGDVVASNAWGEQEENAGNTLEYNKVYISLIPPRSDATYFINGTLDMVATTWEYSQDHTITGTIYLPSPSGYNTDFKEDVLQYLEPRKHINVYETFVIPNLVYFRFEIGLRIKRIYNFNDVRQAVLDKLTYYFDPMFRSFGEKVNFLDIHDFILNEDITSDDYDFANIRGIQNLVFRDVVTYTDSLSGADKEEIFEPSSSQYPQFVNSAYSGYVDNVMRPVKLDRKQFPVIADNHCTFINEG